MDYKEKYNKLVESIKKLQEANPSDEGIQNWVNDNVPELRESEDEKIRGTLLSVFKEAAERIGDNREWDSGITYMSVVAWLEKQAEHQKFCDSIQVGDRVTRNEDGVLVNLSQLNRVAKKDEKQGEQKPAWTEEDSMIQNGIILDGVVYELTTGFPDNRLSLCGNCELNEKCIEFDGSLCYFFKDNFRKVFRKVKMERKL